MTSTRACLHAGTFCVFLLACFAAPLGASRLALPPEAASVLEKIYSFDLDRAVQAAQQIQQERPDHPLGYLLEAEARWWKIWCTSAEFKYGMSDARHRAKLAADKHYLDLAAKVSSLADSQIKQGETAEMQFYAGMGDALAARMYGLRWEGRNTARAGVRAREHLMRAKVLDQELADVDLGLGLYDYYVDTLSGVAKILRFFMGIPGGTKQEGVRLLERDIAEAVLTQNVARFYLAISLHRYDQHYEKAFVVISPLAEKYPSNPLFQLARGDLYAKLGRKEQALDCYRAAVVLPVQDAECRARIRQLVSASLAALGVSSTAADH
jgi:tetratricopeptide (TPR) repeat protein